MIVRAGRVEPGPVGITRLVAPLDGSSLAEEALPVATAISRQLGTSIVLVEAVNPAALIPPTVGAGALIPAEIYDETADALEQEAQAYLAAVAGRLREQGLPVATRVLTGPPSPAIMDAVALGDVIVLCSHGRSGVQRWLLGSVAEQLVRGARVPVILVPAAERARMAS
jgi:nucleotide-binding universal stress UspA family protein